MCLLAFQCLNEILDAVQWMRWTGEVNWAGAFSDVVLTVALPVLSGVLVMLLERRHLRVRSD